MSWKFWQSTDPVYMQDEPSGIASTISKLTGALIGAYLLLVVALGWWWDYEPDIFDVGANANDMAQQAGHTQVTGYVSTATFITLADTLMSKRGGYLSNDLAPPGIWMDNMPEWEFGVLTLLRDTARVYRNDFSRSQSQSIEDKDLSEAEGKFFFDNSSWMLPQTEDEYRDGIRFFESYLTRLADRNQSDAQFYARADNLQQWLAAVETRLGSMSQRLSASVGKRQLNTDLAGDSAAAQATDAPQDSVVKTTTSFTNLADFCGHSYT